MFTLPPYIYEKDLYPQIPQADRWIFNKLELMERLGIEAGPTGMNAPRDGFYCVKSMMNLHGMGAGGFYKARIDSRDIRHSARIANKPGYFWMPWYDGEHSWVQYINDQPATYSRGTQTRSGLLSLTEETVGIAPPLPAILQNISRHMLVEYIQTALAHNVIEAAPRFMGANARQELIDEYKNNVDPSYDPKDLEFGTFDMQRVRTRDGDGWTWDDAGNRRAHVMKPFD